METKAIVRYLRYSRLLERLSVLALFFFSVLGIAGGDPLSRVAEQASGYAHELARDAGADYTPTERAVLRDAAQTLVGRGRCAQAMGVAKQVVSGETVQPGFADWTLLATAAFCAKNWHDAVNAAYVGYGAAADDSQRRQALMLLGRSLEAHWRFSSEEALAAYRKAVEYGDSDPVRKAVQRLEQSIREEQSLRLERHFVQVDGALPAICLDFNAAMPEPGEQAYQDVIRFEPDFRALFRKQSADEICAEGAEYGTDYNVRVLPGVRSVDGQEVVGAQERRVRVGDREPSLWFGNSRYVLPRGGGVPVHGVNVERARLTLYRVGERNLLHQDVVRAFRTDIGRHQAKRLRDALGEQIWQGEAELSVRRNREAVTNLPLATLTQPQSGVYVLTAEPVIAEKGDEDGNTLAAQWLLVSDIGLSTYRGPDSLTVVVRSLESAQPLAGVRLALYGRNNQRLAETLSDANGVAGFDADALDAKGGREPVTLMAFGPGDDFNFLDITGSPFDLSDRGVNGRPAAGPLDAFLYTERGVYRPGERLHLGVLLRDDRGEAVDGLPLTVRLLRPDEQIAAEQVIHPAGAGGYSLELPLSASARTGRWKLLAYLDRDADPIGRASFLIQAIVPPRIELDLTKVPEAPLQKETEGQFTVNARYLFGAPGADLAASGEVRIEVDPDPFPGYSGYRFGPVDEPEDSVLLPLKQTRTDDSGDAHFPFRLERLPKSRRPLRAQLRAEVADVDGRSVAAARWVPVRHQPLVIGVKPAGEDGALQEGAEALFEVRVLNPDGTPRAHSGLSYRLVREQAHYQWYRDQGRWQYKRQVRDRVLRDGKLVVSAEMPGRVTALLEYGTYRLEVRETQTSVLTSVRVRAGWEGGGPDAETPDMLTLRSDRKVYRPGDSARLHVLAPFSGPAQLVIATDRVLSVQPFMLSEREQVLEVPVDPEWGAGAYALVTAYRPDGARAGLGPRRAVGVAWLGLDTGLRKLNIAIQVPEQTRPRQTLDVDILVQGQQQGEAVFVTLAAVDEGVLRLTDYRTPDPLSHYFGQRALGVGLRDLYGRLIDGHAGSPGRLRSGGGAAGRRDMPDSHVEIVSLYSGIVHLDASGRGRVPLQLPDFAGRLRWMAIAWNTHKLGSAEGEVTVRDPLVLMPSGPRFLAAGDRSRASVLMHNVEGPDGEYRLSWQADGALGLVDGANQAAVELHRGQRQVLNIPLRAVAVGNGSLTLRLEGPEGLTLTRKLAIGVRAAFLPQTRRTFGRLLPGATETLGVEPAAGLRPETVSTLLSISARPDLDVPGLLRQLHLYPYGCLEQVTSRAFPLLHLERLSRRWDYTAAEPVNERLADAVTRILDLQLDNGAFSLWRPGGEPEPWLSAYVLDFLRQARAAEVEVPDFAWRKGLEWLRRQVKYPEINDAEVMAVQAYALYLLARTGEVHAETARYLLDQAGEQLPSGMAAAQLGAVLSMLGDAERSRSAFELAAKLNRDETLRDYGSRLRDLAALILMQAELGDDSVDPATLLKTLAEGINEREWLSTQEQAWLVRVAGAISGEGAPLRLSVQGTTLPERQTPLVLRPTPEILAGGVVLGNGGKESAWYSLAVDGSPAEAPAPLQAGFTISRSLYDLSGKPMDPQSLTQGDMLVVVLDGRAETEGLTHQALVIDPLPAGLEVENAELAHARGTAGLDWLNTLSDSLYAEALDDRYVAALDLVGEGRTFRLAYLARAVTPGRYRMPPPEVEDMYKPRYRGRGEARWLVVAPAE